MPNSKKRLVHFVARCLDCEWGNEDFLKGQQSASNHAKNHGHRVDAELGYAMRYGGED